MDYYSIRTYRRKKITPEIRVVIPDKMESQLDALMRAGQAGNKAELVRAAVAQYLLTMPFLSGKEYDRSLEFSPEGRIYQVEYAVCATNLGPSAVGVCCQEGVVLVKEKGAKEKQVMLAPSYEFIHHLNDRIAITTCGIGADGQLVIKKGTDILQEPSKGNDSDISNLAKHVGRFIHSFTLKKNSRVLGVSALIGGIDQKGETKLFALEPSGTLWQVNAYAFGQHQQEIFAVLKMGISSVSGFEDAIQLALAAIMQEKRDFENYAIEIIDTKSLQFRTLTPIEREKYQDKIK